MAKEIERTYLLDSWTPPKVTNKNGEELPTIPIAFISTSFTFSSEFFEEECLTRFLQMETEKENDGAAFLIEREEKLAGLQCAMVAVDQNHCKGNRSLRWDLIPCRVHNGVMHAKISILHWSGCIRIIIGSANLTECGYCINQEIFSVVDYYNACDTDLRVIDEVLKYLRTLLNDCAGKEANKKFKTLEEGIRKTLRKWNVTQRIFKNVDVQIYPILLLPAGNKNGLEKIAELSTSLGLSPFDQAYITSPFFDEKDSENTPSRKIFEILRQRGNIYVNYNVVAEKQNEKDEVMLVKAPEFLNQHTRKSDTTEINFHQIEETGKDESGKEKPRPLHTKSIWLTNSDWHLYMIGSSNFSSPGLCLGRRKNYEANLVYVLSQSRNNKAYKELHEGFPQTQELDVNKLKFQNVPNEDNAEANIDGENLPDCFGEAVFHKVNEQLILELNFKSQNLPSGFELLTENSNKKSSNQTSIYNEVAWKQNGQQLKIQLEWDEKLMPENLLVKWTDAKGFAIWPVIIDGQSVLPPVDELRDLPLDALIQLLSSSQPLHRMLKLIERWKNKSKASNGENVIIDAHQLVDTSRFLLQRTRRVSYAMYALCERLQKPVFTLESLQWRLSGPIGVAALVEAITKEAKSDEEKKFLLAEIGLELSRVIPQVTELSLKAEIVKDAIKKIIDDLSNDLEKVRSSERTTIGKYSVKALKKAKNEC